MKSNLFSNPSAAAGPKDQGRARVKVAVFSVLAVHVAGLTALLLTQGCRRETPPEAPPEAPAVTNVPVLVETNLTSMVQSNLAPVYDPLAGQPTGGTPPLVDPVVATATKYKIKKGDSYATIAKQFPGVTSAAIAAANPGLDPRKLQIDQEINIPAPTAPTPVTAVVDVGGPTTYKVVSGDTLSLIAKKHGTTVKAIQTLNGMSTTSIKAGQTLKIPAKAAPVPAPEPPPVVPITPLPAPTPAPGTTTP